VIVGGTGAFGGGSRLGRADPGDGLADVAVVEAGPRVALVRRAWGMRTGRLEDQQGVVHVRGDRLDLEVPPGTAFNVDGELWEPPDRGPVHIEALPGGVQVLVS
jgi:diacylglycerol kinase family enzyme